MEDQQGLINNQQWEMINTSPTQQQQQQQQQLLTAFLRVEDEDEDDDFKLQQPFFSSSSNYPQNILSVNDSPSSLNLYSMENNRVETSPMINWTEPRRPKRLPKSFSWNTSYCYPIEETLVVPKGEIPLGGLNCHGNMEWRYPQILTEKEVKRNSNQVSRRLPHADYHIIAERKRREKLSQRFVALASVIPGLKKMDKATILGDAIKYVKELEQTIKSLEDKDVKRTVESAVLVKRSNSFKDNSNGARTSLTGENIDARPSSSIEIDYDEDQPWGNQSTKIDVRFCEKMVLLRIHCENHKGVLVKVLSELEKFQLMVINTSAMSFVGSFLDITVTAQMEEGFATSVKELVKEINSAISQFKW